MLRSMFTLKSASGCEPAAFESRVTATRYMTAQYPRLAALAVDEASGRRLA